MQNERTPFLFEAVEPEVLKAVEYAAKNALPVLLKGETGTGKTSLVRALARKYGREFRRINLNGSTTADEFVGHLHLNQEGTYWIDGILTDAMRKGHWLLVDEINAARPEILFALHSLLDDDRQILLPDNRNEVVRPHPDFRFFAGMNPRDYAGTNEMNKALISRFPVVVEVGFRSPEIEAKIVKAHTEFADDDKIKEFIIFANEVRRSYANEEINFIVSPREIIAACNLLHNGFSLREALTIAILNKCEKEDKVALQGLMKLQFGLTDDFKQGKTLGEREKEIKEAESKLKEIGKSLVQWRKDWTELTEKIKKAKEKKAKPDEKLLEEIEQLRTSVVENADEAIRRMTEFTLLNKAK